MYNYKETKMNMCEYGCGNPAKFVLKNGRNSCSKYSTQCPMNKKKNSIGLETAYSEGRMSKSIFTEEHRAKSNESKILNIKANPFETWGRKLQLQEIREQQNNSCLFCGISEWRGQFITLELDHIDGNSSNNVRENLRLLCPNCHSQTDTWRGRNINSGVVRVPDEELLDAILQTKNIRSALIKVQLAPKGGNYRRAKKLLSAYEETRRVESLKVGEPCEMGIPSQAEKSEGVET